MSVHKLHVITAGLAGWEVARQCLWHRINQLLATKGKARLREHSGARAPLPKPPPGQTFAAALSALRIAARGLAIHFDIADDYDWLALGNCSFCSNGFPTAESVEYDLQRAFTGPATNHLDAEFWQREIVEPTTKHAERLRVCWRAQQAKASAVTLSPRQWNALQGAEDLQAFGPDSRVSAAEIAKRAENASADAFKRALADLVKKELLASTGQRGGSGGGYWLTSEGRAVLAYRSA